MTIDEALEILVDRIGWKEDYTLPNFLVSNDAGTSDSGRYFQEEHNALTLQNIRETQPNQSKDDAEFNLFLVELKRRASRKVLTDAFEKDYIDDGILAKYPMAFDNVISLQMTILVAEQIMTSVRSNRIERLTNEWVGKLNYDIYRAAPENFSLAKGNFIYTLGIATRYGYELRSLQRRFGTQRNLLKTITKGQVVNPLSTRKI